METFPPDLRLWMGCKIYYRLGRVSACDTHVHVFTMLRTYDSHTCCLLVLCNILLSRLLDRRRNWVSESNNRRYCCGCRGLVYPRIEYGLKETREGNSRDLPVLILRESMCRVATQCASKPSSPQRYIEATPTNFLPNDQSNQLEPSQECVPDDHNIFVDSQYRHHKKKELSATYFVKLCHTMARLNCITEYVNHTLDG